jgi:[ribosomal protein S5]-alanine N-acetyltransferase
MFSSVARVYQDKVLSMILETPRLFLIQLPLEVMKTRLLKDHFTAFISELNLEITFPPEYPGDALDFFESWAVWVEANGHPSDQPGGCVVHKLERLAIGQIGLKGQPDTDGSVEIGYGLNATHHNLGYSTEAVSALVNWAFESGFAKRVTAETLESNLASNRVLEKLGFAQFGSRFDAEEGGDLILWERI